MTVITLNTLETLLGGAAAAAKAYVTIEYKQAGGRPAVVVDGADVTLARTVRVEIRDRVPVSTVEVDPTVTDVTYAKLTVRSYASGTPQLVWNVTIPASGTHDIGDLTQVDPDSFEPVVAGSTVAQQLALKANSADLGTAAGEDVEAFATAEQGEKADSAYQKPESGVPATDLEEAVRTSLGKADSAYQKPAGGVPGSDLTEAVRTSLGKADGAAQKDQNLNDVVDKAAARTNLDVFSKAEANAAIADGVYGRSVRMDALAAGKRLHAKLLGDESEVASGVTVGAMVGSSVAAGTTVGAVTFTDSTNTVTTAAAHGLEVGDTIIFGTVTSSTGFGSGSVYFVVAVPTETTFQFSYTDGGAVANIINDGSAVACWKRERSYDRQNAEVNPRMRVTGTRPVQATGTYPRYEYIKSDPTIVTYAPGSLVGCVMRVEGEYFGKKLDLILRYTGANNPVRVLVDGRLAKTVTQADFTGASIASGSVGRLPLTFSDARRRRITLQFSSIYDEFPGFDVEAGYTVELPTGTTKGPRVLISGDSFTEGVGAGTDRNYVQWVADMMGWTDVWKAGSGGTGYTEDGTRLALIDRYEDDIVAQGAQIVIIPMGLNDRADYVADSAAVIGAAETIWDATLASEDTVELVIIGPWPNGGGVSVGADLIAMDAQLAALAKEKGVRYISPVSEGWQYPLADTEHPDPDGHEYIGWRVAGHLSVPFIAS